MAWHSLPTSRTSRAARAACVGLGVAGAVAAASCKKGAVGVHVGVPSEVGADVTWIEVGAYANASCDAVRAMLGGGVPNGFATRLAFRSDSSAVPRVGDLPNAKYAFAAVAKNASCGAVATGCSEVDLGDADGIDIALTTLRPASEGCAATATCEAARCVPSIDPTNPALGAGCSLELVGTGPLAVPYHPGVYLSAPSIVATDDGFLVAYREADVGGARVTLLPIDATAGFSLPAQRVLAWPCADASETDGAGLLVDGSSGQLILARPACDRDSGLELVNFTRAPDVTIAQAWTNPAPGAHVSLSFGHVAARRPSDAVVTFTKDGEARIATVRAEAGVVSPSGSFGTGATGAWVAASSDVLALLAAGAEGGAAQMQLRLAPANTPLTDFDAAQPKANHTIATFPGVWGAVAATGKRAVVLAKATGDDARLALRTFDFGATPKPDATAIDGTEGALAADATLWNDRAFFAWVRGGDVEIAAYGDASKSPKLLRRLSLVNDSRTNAVSVVRDGRVTIAASDGRVAVAWTTTSSLGVGDAVGGYAVYACTP